MNAMRMDSITIISEQKLQFKYVIECYTFVSIVWRGMYRMERYRCNIVHRAMIAMMMTCVLYTIDILFIACYDAIMSLHTSQHHIHFALELLCKN